MKTPPVFWNKEGFHHYQQTSLKDLGKQESFLEEVIFNNFECLGLTSLENGVYGPYVCWQQVSVNTPEGRNIRPDIVAISASGHFIVVEVKRGNSQDLKDRAVISQIMDYAASFSAYSLQDLSSALAESSQSVVDWEGFIGDCFPEVENTEDLARVLQRRIKDGEINLVIACDYSPLGTRELLRGVASQSAVGFQLQLIELTPYVDVSSTDEQILFIADPQVRTEIIARTAVTVRIEEGAGIPGIDLKTSTIEDIQQSLRDSSDTREMGRKWKPTEVEDAFRARGSASQIALLDFCKEYGHEGKLISPGPKKRPAFGFYVTVLKNGTPHSIMAFNCTLGWDSIWMYMRFGGEGGLGEESNAEYIAMLNASFNGHIDFSKKEPSIPLELLNSHCADFIKSLAWLRERLN